MSSSPKEIKATRKKIDLSIIIPDSITDKQSAGKSKAEIDIEEIRRIRKIIDQSIMITEPMFSEMFSKIKNSH